jgi:endonuclease-3
MPDTGDMRAIIRVLRGHYGRLPRIPTTDPFELILWENVAYLAPPERRAAAFELLKREVGTAASDILAASDSALQRVTAHGIMKSRFAAKLRRCAQIAMESFGGNLQAVVFGPLPGAKKALRQFPGIGEPGAEKILLFAGAQSLLAPDSNAIRVLSRLGLIKEEPSYARMYAASREVAAKIRTYAGMRAAHELLRHHGQTLCKRGTPKCTLCPLAPRCAFVRGAPRAG